MTDENTTASTDVENPRLIELRNDLLDASVQTLTNDSATYEFDPIERNSTLKLLKKPTWLSLEGNQMLNDYLVEFDLQPNDLVVIEDDVRTIMARNQFSTCYRQFGTYIVIDRSIVTASDLSIFDYELMKKSKDEFECYRNYTKKFDKVFKYKLKRVGESYQVSLKNVFLHISEDNKITLTEPTIESRFREIGTRSPLPLFMELDTFSHVTYIHTFLGMKKQ